MLADVKGSCCCTEAPLGSETWLDPFSCRQHLSRPPLAQTDCKWFADLIDSCTFMALESVPVLCASDLGAGDFLPHLYNKNLHKMIPKLYPPVL